jgi:ABC-type polysaccharide/polyol phosphate transport system ATPase subunit
MYLRASNITIDFPLSSGSHSSLASNSDDSLLGGQIHHVRGKSFVRALADVSLHLEKGDRLALIGHNGSGKSTLLRALAGIYHPTLGSIESDGKVSGIFNMSLGLRQEATGYRNLLLKGLIAGRSRRQIEAALPEIAEFTGLGPYLDMPIHTYSQGMAMRLAFAATTAFSNDILVMDEWIGAGDAGFQEKIIDRMNDFLHASTIIVLASHSTTLLRRIANKALWLEQGRIRMAGGMEVVDAYETEVAQRMLPQGLRELIAGRSGMWVAPAGGTDMQLAWNLETAAQTLELRVLPEQGPAKAIRNISAQGAWRLPAWAHTGLAFDIYDVAGSTSIASIIVPPR